MFNKKKLTAAVMSLIMAAGISGCGETNSTSSGADTVTQAEKTTAADTAEVNADNGSDKSADNSADSKNTAAEKHLSIVCTIFPEYDWVKEILGEKAENSELTYLLDSGADLHSYQPTAEDIIKISTCDMFIYVGGESDEWVEDVLDQAVNKDMKVINLMDIIGDSAKVEELKEGMQEEEHDHDHHHSKEVSAFEDDEVRDRSLSDWEGKWQSGYPLALDGSLDEAFEEKAEHGSMTAKEYKEYYINGYETKYDHITIDGESIEFTDDQGNVTKSDYEYKGFFIQDWSTGTRAAMYRFEAVDKESGAPIFIEFNDHMIEPEEAEHFHIRMSDESYDAIVDPENKFPTFYPAELSPEEVCEELAGHDHHDDDEDEHDENEHHHDEDEEEYDEHVWLSLKNAEIFCAEIASDLGELDPANADIYKANLNDYKTKLSTLDSDYESLFEKASNKTLIFGDRFPFRYFVDDYGLDYYAAFIGCSAETEASFETVIFLAGKLDELDNDTVYIIENSDGKIAQSIIDASSDKDQSIAVLNSVQSVSADDIAAGETYLGIMQSNYDVLKNDLS